MACSLLQVRNAMTATDISAAYLVTISYKYNANYAKFALRFTYLLYDAKKKNFIQRNKA